MTVEGDKLDKVCFVTVEGDKLEFVLLQLKEIS